MDIFNHGLWSYAIFHNSKNYKDKIAAAAFGILPDFVSFFPATVYMIVNGMYSRQSFFSGTSWVFSYAFASYNYTHSLVIFALAVLLVYAWKRKVYLPMLMWGLHILMDIFTHPDFFKTPIFYPLSDYNVPWGIRWGDPRIFFPNYALLIIVFVIFWYRDHKKRHKR